MNISETDYTIILREPPVPSSYKDETKPTVDFSGAVEMNTDIKNKVLSHNFYMVECFDKNGNLKWTEEVPNIVVNAGLNDLLSNYFKGAAYTSAFYVGLKLTGSIAAGDTLASHAGWSEASGYTGSRKALVLGSVASQSVDNSASKASFAITGSATITGAFLCTVASGTSGVLYGAAEFAASRAVENGDTLNVTVTLTAATA